MYVCTLHALGQVFDEAGITAQCFSLVHAHCTYLLKTGQHWRCITSSEDVLSISVPMIQCNIRAAGVKVKTHWVKMSSLCKIWAMHIAQFKSVQIWVYNGEEKSNLKSKYHFLKSTRCKIWMQIAKKSILGILVGIFPTGIGKMHFIYQGFLCGGPSAGRHEVRSKKENLPPFCWQLPRMHVDDKPKLNWKYRVK